MAIGTARSIISQSVPVKQASWSGLLLAEVSWTYSSRREDDLPARRQCIVETTRFDNYSCRGLVRIEEDLLRKRVSEDFEVFAIGLHSALQQRRLAGSPRLILGSDGARAVL